MQSIRVLSVYKKILRGVERVSVCLWVCVCVYVRVCIVMVILESPPLILLNRCVVLEMPFISQLLTFLPIFTSFCNYLELFVTI
jgi:hypothetical protein